MPLRFLLHPWLRPRSGIRADGWGTRQSQVITALPSARLVVQGGPGTGKTALACARAAALIRDQSVPAASILLISFTRIAVREIRERIAAMLGPDQPDSAQHLVCVTLDALAALIMPDPEGDDSHDSHIRRVTHGLQTYPSAAERLLGYRHVLVDEAHDIVGIRADLVQTIIGTLHRSCGVTVLADDAQSIYDFSDTSRVPKPSIPIRLEGAGWPVVTLDILYRTQQSALRRLYQQGRKIVLDTERPPTKRWRALTRALIRAAGNPKPLPEPTEFTAETKPLVLFRRRADVLVASRRFCQAGVAHRLRISGHAAALPPWIAQALGGWLEPDLPRGRFLRLWDEKVDGTFLATCTSETAWDRLFDTAAAGRGAINLERLRSRLSAASPPIALSEAELGTQGPLLGTIHASKGREAEQVVLALLAEDGTNRAVDADEVRVLYVGATRARQTLRLCRITAHPASVLKSGRTVAIDPHDSKRAIVEIGLDTDMTAVGLVGRAHIPHSSEALAIQARLATLPAQPLPCLLRLSTNGAYGLYRDGDGACLGYFANHLRHDLDETAARLERIRSGLILALPTVIAPVYVIGVRTLAFDPEPLHGDLHAPWAASGLILAPTVTGFVSVDFVSPVRDWPIP